MAKLGVMLQRGLMDEKKVKPTQDVLCTEKGKDNTYAAFVKANGVWSDARQVCLDGIDEDGERASAITRGSFTRNGHLHRGRKTLGGPTE